MKKTALLIIGIATLAVSCNKGGIFDKKEKPKRELTTAPTTVRSASVDNQSVAFGTDRLIGSYDHNTGGRQIQIASDFTIGGTVSLSKIRNMYFIIRKDTAEIYRSSKRPTVSAINPTNNWITLPKGGKYSTSLYVDIDSGAIGTITSKIHTQFQAADTAGWMDEVTGQTITVQLYKNSPTLFSEGSSEKISNEDFAELNTLRIQSPSSDRIAVKQVSYQATFANNSGSGTMRFDSLRLFIGGDDVTGKWIFVNDAGTTITSISQNSSVKLFHAVAITGSPDEAVIPQGSETDFVLKGVVRGFGGDSVISDIATITPVTDAAPMTAGYVYLNKGTSGLDAKLYNSWIANSSAKRANFVWSPMKYQPHSAGYGAAVPDWYNGYGIKVAVTPSISHSRSIKVTQ